ncbi:hypothetical protein Tsubulata_037394 [Turnera subulata]|uniref:Uncharacterized protein n=1 Tax=Turnera subulata TaxID=218843 RepID=A0A9Q0G2S8_9ROSI|nr:hypothetical protein Tsubulata_037394 [Turnera subulata]
MNTTTTTKIPSFSSTSTSSSVDSYKVRMEDLKERKENVGTLRAGFDFVIIFSTIFCYRSISGLLEE